MPACACDMNDPLLQTIHHPERARIMGPPMPGASNAILFSSMHMPHVILQFISILVQNLKEHDKLDRLKEQTAKRNAKDAGLVRFAYYFRDKPFAMLMAVTCWFTKWHSPFAMELSLLRARSSPRSSSAMQAS